MKKLLLLVFFTSILVLSGCSSMAKSGKPIKDFNYIDQDGNPLGLEDLKGKYGSQILCLRTARQPVRQ